MLDAVSAEALKRLAASYTILRLIEAQEKSAGSGDDITRTLKGLIFVQNYATYEYVVVHSVRALVSSVNSRGLQFASIRVELLAMALDGEFSSVVNCSLKKTWDARLVALRKSCSTDVVRISDGLFPKDGSQFRPSQLETLWKIFGMPLPIVPDERLRGRITEMVETRNQIAHGNESPADIGRRFDVIELKKRIDDTQAVCTHLITSVTGYALSPSAFSR